MLHEIPALPAALQGNSGANWGGKTVRTWHHLPCALGARRRRASVYSTARFLTCLLKLAALLLPFALKAKQCTVALPRTSYSSTGLHRHPWCPYLSSAGLLFHPFRLMSLSHHKDNVCFLAGSYKGRRFLSFDREQFGLEEEWQNRAYPCQRSHQTAARLQCVSCCRGIKIVFLLVWPSVHR